MGRSQHRQETGIGVHTTVGINPLDNTFRSGHHYAATPENLPRVGGQMGAGIVVETKSANFKIGDRVFVTGPGFGVIADGTWRELVAAPAAGVRRIPSHIDAKVFPLSDAADAVRYLIEDRPFGRVLMRVGTDSILRSSGNPL